MLTFFTTLTFAQENDLTSNLYESYETFKESSLNKRRVKHHELQPLIAKLVANPKFKVNKVGESIEGRYLNLISSSFSNQNSWSSKSVYS